MDDIRTSAMASTVEAVVGSTGFSGVVRVDSGGSTVLDAAFGLADRRHGVPMTTSTRLGTASGTKGLTALHVLTVPVHTLETTEDYVPVLDGHSQVFEPGERCVYNNSAFVVLAIVAGRVGGHPFEDLLVERVCRPAGMTSTSFLRGDDLPGDAATGYPWTDRDRTNVLHLPVVGSGDGGAYSTSADVAAMWGSLFAGRILPAEVVEDAMRRRNGTTSEAAYGLGFELRGDGVVALTGSDAGVSFRSVHDRRTDVTWTVISNTSEGAWPVARILGEHLAAGAQA